jgi:hypothetical protein
MELQLFAQFHHAGEWCFMKEVMGSLGFTAGVLSDRAMLSGHANHATHACVLSRSLEWTHKAAATAAHFFCSSWFVISSLVQCWEHQARADHNPNLAAEDFG